MADEYDASDGENGYEDDVPSIHELGQLFEQAATIPELPANLYAVFSQLADMFLQYRDAAAEGRTTGWARNVRNMDGGPAFSEDEAAGVEAAVGAYEDDLRDYLDIRGLGSMRGGAEADAVAQAAKAAGQTAAAEGKAAADRLLALAAESIDPRNVSLDVLVEKVFEQLDAYDHHAQALARELGITKLEQTIPEIPLQPLGIPFGIPTRLIVILVQGVLEFLRLFSAMFGTPGAIVRIFASIAAGLIEAGKGDVKSAVLTFIGVAGTYPMLFGLALKIIVKVYGFVAPDLRDEQFWLAYRSAKSWTIGVIAFLFSVFAPTPVRLVADGFLGSLNGLLGEVGAQIEATKAAIPADAYPFKCFNVKWLDIGADPLTLDTLANLQELFHAPEFFCNPRVRELVQGFGFVPPIRLLVELMGLPTTEAGFRRTCMGLPADVLSASLADAVVKTLKPSVSLKPPTERPAGCEAERDIAQATEEAKERLDTIFAGGAAAAATPAPAQSSKSIRTWQTVIDLLD